MRLLSLTALTVCLAAPAVAQNDVPQQTADPRANPAAPFGQTADQLRADPTGIDARTVQTDQMRDARVLENPTVDNPAGADRMGTVTVGDLDRLDRDVRTMGDDPDMQRYQQEGATIRRDYDALGTTPTPQDRMDVMNRYQALDANVRAARMNRANRADYFRMADDRLGMYDRDIESARADYMNETGNMRAERARDLIQLRRQRDMYRNDVFDVRGAGRSGFDDARRTAAPNLMRYDTDFRNMRHESMMRGTMTSPGMNGGMRN